MIDYLNIILAILYGCFVGFVPGLKLWFLNPKKLVKTFFVKLLIVLLLLSIGFLFIKKTYFMYFLLSYIFGLIFTKIKRVKELLKG